MEVVIVTYIPVDLSICGHCVYVGRWAGVKLIEPAAGPTDGSRQLSSLVAALLRAGLRVVVIDAFTSKGLWLMLRHRSGRLPLVVAGGKLIHSGPLRDPEELAERLVALAVSNISQ
ncbi:MAG: hypothetical protein ACK4M3_00045, partial [Pyrobaculum sp.]